MKSFNDLLVIHRQLDQEFLEHQRALIRGDLIAALRRLDEYERQLLDHIKDEEEILLPIFGARVEAPVGGSAEIFRNEHIKIRDYVELLKAEIPKLSKAEDRERAAIFMLDSETTFKRLMVHHDNREQKFLYPRLDQVTTEGERAQIFQKLRSPGN
ncbi:MAG TPA: hemerythrin domain-containing protein [Pyrinomonadaceae bacterium]